MRCPVPQGLVLPQPLFTVLGCEAPGVDTSACWASRYRMTLSHAVTVKTDVVEMAPLGTSIISTWPVIRTARRKT